MYYVYIIKCNDSKFYTGTTSNLNRWYLEHRYGKGGKFTRDRKVIRLLYLEKYLTQREALRRKRQIKGWRHEKKENLIRYGKPFLPG